MSTSRVNFEGSRQFILQKLKDGLSPELAYHSLIHILDVYRIAEKLSEMEGVKGEELTLIRTAALFHDSGFLEGSQEHEKVSCQLARQYLPEFGFSTVQISLIEGMIMATKIPQTPHNILEEIICDADLDYLGRDDFWIVGQKLYTELKNKGIIDSELDWNRQQVAFLENHKYFTKSANSLRKAQKESHLTEIKSRL